MPALSDIDDDAFDEHGLLKDGRSFRVRMLAPEMSEAEVVDAEESAPNVERALA